MVSYPRRPQSGLITCYLNRAYHVLPTIKKSAFDKTRAGSQYIPADFWVSSRCTKVNLLS